MRGRKGTVYRGRHARAVLRALAGGIPGGPRRRSHRRPHRHRADARWRSAACTLPKDRKIDGKSLRPLLEGRARSTGRTARCSSSGTAATCRSCTAPLPRAAQRWRLVQPAGVGEGSKFDETKLMLFDIEDDPYEVKDVAAANAEIVASLKKQYEDWFNDVKSTRNFAPPRIVAGSEKENPTILTRQDWRSKDGSWTPKSLGHWDVQIDKAGELTITGTLLNSPGTNATLHLKVADRDFTMKPAKDVACRSLPFSCPRSGPPRILGAGRRHRTRRPFS